MPGPDKSEPPYMSELDLIDARVDADWRILRAEVEKDRLTSHEAFYYNQRYLTHEAGRGPEQPIPEGQEPKELDLSQYLRNPEYRRQVIEQEVVRAQREREGREP